MHSLPRAIVYLPLTWHLLGCAGGGWTTHEVTPRDTKQVVHAGEARVETTAGQTYRLRGVWVSQDSLGGWLVEPAGQEVAMPLSAVARAERRSSRRQSTSSGGGGRGGKALAGMAIGGALGAVGPLIALATCGEDSGSWCEGASVFALLITVPAGMLLGALFGAAAQ